MEGSIPHWPLLLPQWGALLYFGVQRAFQLHRGLQWHPDPPRAHQEWKSLSQLSGRHQPPLTLCWQQQQWRQRFFCQVWLELRSYFRTFSVLVGHPFPSPSVRESRLVSVRMGISELTASSYNSGVYEAKRKLRDITTRLFCGPRVLGCSAVYLLSLLNACCICSS